jgi:hypothetical protein
VLVVAQVQAVALIALILLTGVSAVQAVGLEGRPVQALVALALQHKGIMAEMRQPYQPRVVVVGAVPELPALTGWSPLAALAVTGCQHFLLGVTLFHLVRTLRGRAGSLVVVVVLH